MLFIRNILGQVWWYISIIPLLGRHRVGGFQVQGLGYTVNSRSAWQGVGWKWKERHFLKYNDTSRLEYR
jgi:hypothetical protein